MYNVLIELHYSESNFKLEYLYHKSITMMSLMPQCNIDMGLECMSRMKHDDYVCWSK